MNALLNYITELMLYMSGYLIFIAESLFCGALTYLLYRLFLSRVQNYSFQRVILLISLLITVLFPFIDIPVSNPVIAEFFIAPAYVTAITNSASESIMNKDLITNSLGILYLSISVIFLVRLLFQLFKIYSFKQNCMLTESGIGYNIYSSESIDLPFSFGRAVFMPLSYIGEERKMAIRHELSHVDRNHTLDVLFVNILISLMWFNPFLYLFKKKLVEVHEFEADMDVINNGANINEYKELLFIAQFGVTPDISNSLHKSLTFKRFFQMENLKQTKAGMKVITLFSAAILLLFYVTSFSKTVILPDSNNKLLQTQDTTSKTIPFVMVEVKPTFQGGDENNFTKWVGSKLVYPVQAKKDSIQGRVILQFIVAENGKVEDVKVVRGVHPELDKEAVRVVSLSPAWEPGTAKGKKVKVIYTFPVIFQLR